jgi:transposase
MSDLINPKTNGTSKLKIEPRRQFSEAFKEKTVSDLNKGLTTIKDVSSLYDVRTQSIYKWIYKYSIHHKKGTRMVIEMQSEEKKTAELLLKVAELERIVGQKQLTIDYLDKLLDIAGQHYQEDLKKNFATKPSPGSTKI